MASILKVDSLTGVTTAGSISVTGEGNSTTTNLQQGLAKAWVNFNQATVGGSFNTTSVTDSAAGRFVVNIANDMANTEYVISVNARIPVGQDFSGAENNDVARAAGTVPVKILAAGGYYDSTDSQVSIQGDLA